MTQDKDAVADERLPRVPSATQLHVAATLAMTTVVAIGVGETVATRPTAPADPTATCLGIAGCPGGPTALWLVGLLLLTALFLGLQHRA